MRATKNGERSSPAPAEIARAWSAPLWTTRDTSNAAGAAKRPSKPVTGTRAFWTAVPTDRPTQTNRAQETFLAKSATMGPIPKRSPNPPLSRSSMPSIAIPSRIASHAARRSVAPRFEDAAAEAFWVGASLRVSSSILPVTYRTHWRILGHAFPVLPHSYYRYVAALLLHTS